MLVLIVKGIAALSVTETSVTKCYFQGLTMLSASLDSVDLYQISNTKL